MSEDGRPGRCYPSGPRRGHESWPECTCPNVLSFHLTLVVAHAYRVLHNAGFIQSSNGSVVDLRWHTYLPFPSACCLCVGGDRCGVLLQTRLLCARRLSDVAAGAAAGGAGADQAHGEACQEG